jgi:hypothetical protein
MMAWNCWQASARSHTRCATSNTCCGMHRNALAAFSEEETCRNRSIRQPAHWHTFPDRLAWLRCTQKTTAIFCLYAHKHRVPARIDCVCSNSGREVVRQEAATVKLPAKRHSFLARRRQSSNDYSGHQASGYRLHPGLLPGSVKHFRSRHVNAQYRVKGAIRRGLPVRQLCGTGRTFPDVKPQ